MGSARPGRRPAELEPIAAMVQRMGVLLSAGIAPVTGWAYLAEATRGSAGARQVSDAASRGDSIVEALVAVAVANPATAPAWRGLAAAWLVATTAGAPLAATLAEFAGSLRSLAKNQRDLDTALAGPRATALMVLLLPVAGILFGAALGFDSLRILFGTPIGLSCLTAGIALMLVALWWNRLLLRRARPTNLTPGLTLDLMAIALSGGASQPRAQLAVSDARKRCSLDGEDSGDQTIAELLALSSRAGIPAAALLRSEAAEARRAASSAGERTAATLAVTLMLPLGLCVLPAFMLLGVAPLVISIVSSTATGL